MDFDAMAGFSSYTDTVNTHGLELANDWWGIADAPLQQSSFEPTPVVSDDSWGGFDTMGGCSDW